ncbi:MAG: phosphate acyltransferase PlsX [Betaproteobacteria bacterium]|nr:phosphate acyltransferase PlsX [Betaproteobacteria bacterium]
MTVSISVDAMGGDFGPKITVPASLKFLKSHPDAHITLVGNELIIKNFLKKPIESFERLSIVHTTQFVTMDESPQSALKNKKNSSMRLAINLVKEGSADAIVSAGNTGALMATGRFVLRMLPGIDRPAIASFLPNQKGTSCMLDLGANADCTSHHLTQFAIMGSILSSVISKKKRPSIGLLNIGSESLKGNEVTKETYELLKKSHLNFYGNVEGNDIFKGTTDVVVCDGFVGNISLKTTEGLAKMFADFLGQEFKKNIGTKFLALFALPVLKAFKRRLDPRRYNGAAFLGINGIVVKSHGSADAFSFEHALMTAYEEANSKMIAKISKQLKIDQKLI